MKRILMKFGIFLTFTFVAGMVLFSKAQTPELVINEFQASNISSVRNPYNGEYSDWLEIYNAGSVSVEIAGFFLSDDPLEPRKWEIPFDSLLPAGGYLLFWADDINEFNHTNFKLGRSGEYIGLYDTAGLAIDSITFGYQEDDLSYGRKRDELQEWVFFETVTPGWQNAEEYLSGRVPDPVFSLQGGYYSGGQTVSITISDPLVSIHYTLDGSTPDTSDPVYFQSIVIDSTTALRARGFADGWLPGHTVTQTYFINETINLPVISLTTDPENLFDDEIGIYVIGTNGVPGYCTDQPMNLNQDWERPVNVELYDLNGNVEINQQAGVKIYGGCSRTRYPQKSLALFARGIYGKGSFDCQLFKDKDIYSFESFVLRNSADDCRYTMFKDAMGQAILEDMDIDRQAYRPAVVFINGQYWGIHNIREKLNEHYVAENYNLDVDEVNLLTRNPENTWNVEYGDAEHYNTMISYVGREDMTGEEDYDFVSRRMDLNNYIDYQIAEIYLSANDWPSNNIKFWRADDGPYDRWRWIIYDLDNCFIYIERNTLELATDPWCDCNWPNPPWSTLLFRRLLLNDRFKNEFVQRYAWHMNTTFQPERIYHFIDSMQANIAPEIPRHIERWGGQTVPDPEHWIGPAFNSMEEWDAHVDRMKYFISERMPHAQQHVMDYFDLSGMINVLLYNRQPGSGKLKLSDQTVPGIAHGGKYFKDIPLVIKAIPEMGYQFAYWELTLAGAETRRIYEPVYELYPEHDITVVAFFEPAEETSPVVVINEINYHSGNDENPGDWVELFNRKNAFIDLSGWMFKDENDSHIFTFPKGYELSPNGYLVMCEDLAAFRLVFPDVNNIIGDLGFGLNNAGEQIRLFNAQGTLIDAVHYDDAEPWPPEADGWGPTLELLDPSLDNDLAESWQPSYGLGTPGVQNLSNTIEHNSISQNYPNPSRTTTSISVAVSDPGWVTIRLQDIFGRNVSTLVNEYKERSNYEFIIDTSIFPTGVYFYSMFMDNRLIETRKMVVIR